MKTINLEEILKNSNVHVEFLKGLVIPDGNNGTELDRVIDAMKEACKQTLELAAENANMIGETQDDNGAPDIYEDFVYVSDSNGPDYGFIVNKQSILDTINQVKK